MSLSLLCKIFFRVNICRGRGEKEAADGGHSAGPLDASRAVCAQGPGDSPLRCATASTATVAALSLFVLTATEFAVVNVVFWVG